MCAALEEPYGLAPTYFDAMIGNLGTVVIVMLVVPGIRLQNTD
jgi:hypothetical protein